MDRRTFIQLASGVAVAAAVPGLSTVGSSQQGAEPVALPFDGRVITRVEWPDLFDAHVSLTRQVFEDEMERIKFWRGKGESSIALSAYTVEWIGARRGVAERGLARLASITEIPLADYDLTAEDFVRSWPVRHMEQATDGKWLYCQRNPYVYTEGPQVGGKFWVYEISPDQSGIAPEHRAVV